MNTTLSEATLRHTLQMWNIAEPTLIKRIPGGVSSDTWYIETSNERFIGKYAYQSQEDVENGLLAAEICERHGILSGPPIRTKEGKLSVMVEGPHGHREPFALLRFVPGERLQPSEPNAASTYGNLLGRVHTILLQEFSEQHLFDVYDYLTQENTYVLAQPGLMQLISKAVDATRNFEANMQVTYGAIWGDGMEILRDKATGEIGIIDWGAIESGPLLFDVALHVLWFFPEENQAYNEFLPAYLAVAPISTYELTGLTYYKALLWARQAKYYAHRVANNATVGSDAASNAETLAFSRRELESLLATF